jgi:hypothetical protein
MTWRRIFVVLAVVISIASLAYAMRDAMNEWVIVPLAYLWWVIVLYYRVIPQTIMWLLLMAAILFTAGRSFLLTIPIRQKKDLLHKTFTGPIEDLAITMEKQKRGIYYRWLIAHRLGKVARELLDQREGQLSTKRFVRLKGRDWSPPQGVESYLEAGLNGSFADYPRTRWSYPIPTPLDEQPRNVIEYLEGEMEAGLHGDC